MFGSFEKDLRKKILEGEAPFLGLFADDFGEYVRKFLHTSLIKHSSPVDALIKGLDQFPAVFSCYLIIHVMEGFGDAGYFEVYSHLKRALGTEMTPGQRERLWRHFRVTCHFLGLSVSPKTSGTHYMVDEYLRQAGFPLRYIQELVKRMMRLARDVGLPDDDDPDSITLWRQSLLDRLRFAFSIVAREAIERDDKGYYVRAFMKVLKNPSEDGGIVEQKIREAIDTVPEPGQPTHRLSIPQVLFKDMQLGILLPGGQENAWEINVDGVSSSFSLNEGDRFVPFDNALPKNVEIKGTGSVLKRTLWENELNNRLIIFSHPSGRFYQSTSLSEKGLEIDPGRYSIILRFEPDGTHEAVELISEDPAVYVMELQLLPGEEKSLRKGPAELRLQAYNVPNLNWLGESIRGLRGTEFYPSQELKLEIVLPYDMLNLQDTEYEIIVKPGSLGEDLWVQISPDSQGKACLDLDAAGRKWKAGVSRVLAELRRRGSRRGLARSSILLWNGLDHLGRSVFHCQRLPDNLMGNLSENVLVKTDRRQITFRDDIQRFFRLVFEDGSRHHSFTWPVPGVFLALEDHREGGNLERTVKLGSTLAVNSSSRSVLKVYCTEPAVLELGNFKVNIDFSRVGSKRLPLATLLEYVSPESSTLTLRYQGSEVPIPLIELTSPHTVVSFSQVSHLEGHEVHLKLQSAVRSITVTAEDLVNGERSVVEFESGDIDQCISRDMCADCQMTVLPAGENNYGIYLSLNGLAPGFWILDFQAKIGGRWGVLADRKGSIYSGHILISKLGIVGSFIDVYDHIKAFDADKLEGILSRIHRRLLLPYAPECSALVNYLERIWKQIFTILLDQASLDYFFSLLVERPPEVATTSISSQNIGASAPQIFCHPREKYAEIRRSRDNVLVDCLSYFPMLRDPISLFSEGVVDIAVPFGFANVAQIQIGVPPKDFNLGRYQQALRMRDLPERWSSLNDDDWRPGLGDYLGPMHYRYAICRLREDYSQTLAENAESRGQMSLLLRRVIALTVNRFSPVSLSFGSNGPIDLGLFELESGGCKILADEEELRLEDLQRMVRFLSLFAMVCRCEARHAGTLGRFLSELKKKMDFVDPPEREKGVMDVLSNLLYVGEDLFAFYLLLWELVLSADSNA